MPFSLGFAFCVLALSLLPFATSEFTEPSSANGDFVQKWFVGDTIHVAWEGNWNWGAQDKPQTVDLFVMWFNTADNPFWEMLQANITLDKPGKFDWKIDLKDSTLASSTQYVFRLMEHTNPPVLNLKGPRLPSRGFVIYPVPLSSSATQHSSITAPTSAPTSTSTEANPSPSLPATDKPNKNIGAIAGGVVGGLAALALLCGIALLVLRRIKQRRKQEETSEAGITHKRDLADETQAPAELSGYNPTELADAKLPTSELEGSGPREWH